MSHNPAWRTYKYAGKKKKKAERSGETEQACLEKKSSVGSPASCGPLRLGDTAHLSIDGMGIVLFSAEVMKSVIPGSDFLAQEFTVPEQVGAHIRKGDITAFCTGTGGDFHALVPLWLSGLQCGKGIPGNDSAGIGSKGRLPAIL